MKSRCPNLELTDRNLRGDISGRAAETCGNTRQGTSCLRTGCCWGVTDGSSTAHHRLSIPVPWTEQRKAEKRTASSLTHENYRKSVSFGTHRRALQQGWCKEGIAFVGGSGVFSSATDHYHLLPMW